MTRLKLGPLPDDKPVKLTIGKRCVEAPCM